MPFAVSSASTLVSCDDIDRVAATAAAVELAVEELLQILRELLPCVGVREQQVREPAVVGERAVLDLFVELEVAHGRQRHFDAVDEVRLQRGVDFASVMTVGDASNALNVPTSIGPGGTRIFRPLKSAGVAIGRRRFCISKNPP